MIQIGLKKFDILKLKYIRIFAENLSWYLDLRYFIELAVVAFRLILWIPEAMSFIKRIYKKEEVQCLCKVYLFTSCTALYTYGMWYKLSSIILHPFHNIR